MVEPSHKFHPSAFDSNWGYLSVKTTTKWRVFCVRRTSARAKTWFISSSKGMIIPDIRITVTEEPNSSHNIQHGCIVCWLVFYVTSPSLNHHPMVNPKAHYIRNIISYHIQTNGTTQWLNTIAIHCPYPKKIMDSDHLVPWFIVPRKHIKKWWLFRRKLVNAHTKSHCYIVCWLPKKTNLAGIAMENP